jgi:hypothetical protein
MSSIPSASKPIQPPLWLGYGCGSSSTIRSVAGSIVSASAEAAVNDETRVSPDASE